MMLFLVAVVAIGAALSACGPLALGSCTPKGGSTAPGASTAQVVADPNTVGAYQPANLTIRAGQSVTWKWVDTGNQHSVTADDGGFDSCLKRAGSTFTVTFGKPGTYGYRCSIHPQMIGRITVNPA